MKKLASLVFLSLFAVSCATPSLLTVSSNQLSADEAYSLIAQTPELLLFDVRSAGEFQAGHIQGASSLPYGEIPSRAEELLPLKDRKVLVYCGSGMRSRIAAASLERLGFSDVNALAGGLATWRYGTTKREPESWRYGTTGN